MSQIKHLTTIRIIFVLLAAILFASCGDDPAKQAEKDRKKILEYIKKHDLDAHELESGVFYVYEVAGSGQFPTENSTVLINFKGYLLNGKEFDARHNFQIDLRYTSVEGLKYGIPMFDRGSKGMLLIPSGLAYGEYGTLNIPPNSVLIYEIEMIDFYN